MRDKPNAVRALSGILDAGPYIIIGASFILGLCSIIALLGVDVYTGKIVGTHLTQDDMFGLLVSFATTGLIVAAIGVLVEGFNNQWNSWLVLMVGLIVAALLGIDAFFDGVSVDIKRFGEIVSVSTYLSAPEATAHNFYRILVGGISLIGEPLATVSVMFFPAMKKFLRGLFNDLGLDPAPSRPGMPSTNPNSGSNYPRPAQRPNPVYGNYPSPQKSSSALGNFQSRPIPRPAYHPVGDSEES